MRCYRCFPGNDRTTPVRVCVSQWPIFGLGATSNVFHIKVILSAFLALLFWCGISLYGALNGWWLDTIAPPGNSAAFLDASKSLLHEHSKGNAALILIENGTVFAEYFAASTDSVNRDTLFPAASMSKWLSAYAVMKLVDEGKIDLDVAASRYLTRWQLPPSDFDNQKVTVRQLLSHTAGLTDGLGFGDYQPDENIPSLEDSLRQPRASGEDKRIMLGRVPGSEWDYSGGGYLILQLITEEVSGSSFDTLMQRSVFMPVGMSRSTYDYLGSFPNISSSYDSKGSPATIYKYAAKAATGLSTSAADMARFVQSQLTGGGIDSPLNQSILASMRMPHGQMFGMDIWGLGTIMYAPTENGDFIYGHDGANEPAINSSVRINPDNGDAVIVLVTGHKTLATMIGFEWTLWQSGYPDFLLMGRAIESAYFPIASGVLVILLITLLAYRGRYRTKQ